MTEAPAVTPSDTLSPSAPEACLDAVRPALRRLDQMLARAIAAAQVAGSPEGADNPYQGLYISQSEVEGLLAREPGMPAFQPSDTVSLEPWPDPLTDASPLAWVAQAFGLSAFELDVIVIALAPEFDLRYERLYAYLHDDVTRRRPSIDLVLNLLCASPAAKLARRRHFASDAPLIRHGLIHLIADPAQIQPPLLSHSLKLDEQIISLLLGQRSLDGRLASFCKLYRPAASLAALPWSAESMRALAALAAEARQTDRPLRLYFQSPRAAGGRLTAAALAGDLGVPLLDTDLERALASAVDVGQALQLLFREAWLQDALLYIDGVGALQAEERKVQYEQLLAELGRSHGITILAGAQPWLPTGEDQSGVIAVSFPMPDFAQRRACWHRALTTEGICPPEQDLDNLASRFRLAPDQIAAAVVAARSQARWRAAARPGEDGPPPDLARVQSSAAELFSAARAQTGHGLAALTRQIEPRYTWDDIVLPPDQLAQLHEVSQQARYHHIVYGAWGFDRKLALGKGLNVLFTGPPGTGKTMAAEVIASDLELGLYKIDLSQVVSKYIGETERNLDRIFTAAEDGNAILFFDEADALFGKRSEVKDAHDRYANIEVGYLLQKMEEYEGAAILATNLRQHMDEAFVRRMHVIVEFPFPEETYRHRMWEVVFPRETPLGEDVDFATLAREVKLAGGNIKNIALAAAFFAAADGGAIRMAHLARAARREYQKLGRTWDEGAWARLAASPS